VLPDLVTDVLSSTVSVRSTSLTVSVPEVERAFSVSSAEALSLSPFATVIAGLSFAPLMSIVMELLPVIPS